jgi:hypothetical protein
MTKENRSVHPDALPGYEKAIIPRNKLEGYALNTTHSEGQHKARVFKSALGFDISNWQLLEECIINELPYHEAVPGIDDVYGRRYKVVLPITGPNGNTVNVLTAWIIRQGEDYPSLSTLYVTE